VEQVAVNPLLDSVIAAAGQGDRDAMGHVLDALRPELVVLIRQAQVPISDRDDAAQEAVLVVMACTSAYDSSLGSFRGYVCASVRKMLRRFRGTPAHDYFLIDEPLYEPNEAHVRAEEMLQGAPYEDIVREYYGIGCDERTQNQIAAARGIAPKKVRAALQESLASMRSVGGV
jgi:DNA-directed RNA polymerase specialized sigma24 family protein